MNEQRADAYLLISNVAKALVMAFKDIFNESILGRPQQGCATIGGSSLRQNWHTVHQIQNHLEGKFNKHWPVDIQSVMGKFVMEVDTSHSLEKYCKLQLQYQALLEETSEPIRNVSMKRTAIGHFQMILHLYDGYAHMKVMWMSTQQLPLFHW